MNWTAGMHLVEPNDQSLNVPLTYDGTPSDQAFVNLHQVVPLIPRERGRYYWASSTRQGLLMTVYKWEWVNRNQRRLIVKNFNTTHQEWETCLHALVLSPGTMEWEEWWEHHMFVIQQFQLVSQCEVNSEQMSYLAATPTTHNGSSMSITNTTAKSSWGDQSYGARMKRMAESHFVRSWEIPLDD